MWQTTALCHSLHFDQVLWRQFSHISLLCREEDSLSVTGQERQEGVQVSVLSMDSTQGGWWGRGGAFSPREKMNEGKYGMVEGDLFELVLHLWWTWLLAVWSKESEKEGHLLDNKYYYTYTCYTVMNLRLYVSSRKAEFRAWRRGHGWVKEFRCNLMAGGHLNMRCDWPILKLQG